MAEGDGGGLSDVDEHHRRASRKFVAFGLDPVAQRLPRRRSRPGCSSCAADGAERLRRDRSSHRPTRPGVHDADRRADRQPPRRTRAAPAGSPAPPARPRLRRPQAWTFVDGHFDESLLAADARRTACGSARSPRRWTSTTASRLRRMLAAPTPTARPGLRGAQRGAVRGRAVVVIVERGAVQVAQPVHVFATSPSSPTRRRPSAPALLISPNPPRRPHGVESYGGADGRPYFTNGVTQVAAGRRRQAVEHYRPAGRERRGDAHRRSQPPAARQPLPRPSTSTSARAGPYRNDILTGDPRRRGRRLQQLYGLYVPHGASTSTTTPCSTTRSRTATAASCTRACSAIGRSQRLQRPHHRPRGRAEDRRQAVQPQPAAVARCRADTQTPAAGDLRRRRALHARRDGRRDGRGRDLLPAQPRHPAARGPPPAGQGLHRRGQPCASIEQALREAVEGEGRPNRLPIENG